MADPAKSPEAPKPSTAPRFLVVVNNEERLRILVLRGKIDSTSKTIVPGGRIELMPGANIVEARAWQAWKTQNADRDGEGGDKVPGQATMLLAGTIPYSEHRGRSSEGAGKPYLVEGVAIRSREQPLADLDERQAVSVIAEMRDEPLLRRLIQTERRAVVAEAIRAKLEAFAKANANPTI